MLREVKRQGRLEEHVAGLRKRLSEATSSATALNVFRALLIAQYEKTKLPPGHDESRKLIESIANARVRDEVRKAAPDAIRRLNFALQRMRWGGRPFDGPARPGRRGPRPGMDRTRPGP